MSSVPITSAPREQLVAQGRRLEYFTLGWSGLEAGAALFTGYLACSVALVGFGFDSLIEMVSGGVILWRLHRDAREAGRERDERIALRLVGLSLLALSVYIVIDAGQELLRREAPQPSVPGIVLAVVALIVMRLLSRAKRRVAQAIDSAAMKADAKQTDFCAYLSAILRGGLLLNALFGFWWADPVAALVMVPIIAKEGVDALRHKVCTCH